MTEYGKNISKLLYTITITSRYDLYIDEICRNRAINKTNRIKMQYGAHDSVTLFTLDNIIRYPNEKRTNSP